MKRRTKEDWARIVDEVNRREKSGEAIKEICKDLGVTTQNFYQQRKKMDAKPHVIIHSVDTPPRKYKKKEPAKSSQRTMLFVGSVTEIMEVVRGLQ